MDAQDFPYYASGCFTPCNRLKGFLCMSSQTNARITESVPEPRISTNNSTPMMSVMVNGPLSPRIGLLGPPEQLTTFI